jgi:hypothetical protein
MGCDAFRHCVLAIQCQILDSRGCGLTDELDGVRPFAAVGTAQGIYQVHRLSSRAVGFLLWAGPEGWCCLANQHQGSATCQSLQMLNGIQFHTCKKGGLRSMDFALVGSSE